MMNEQHELSFDELDAVTGAGIIEYIVETVHALGQGTGNSGTSENPHPPKPPVCTENLSSGVVVVKSAQDGA
jgi:hypothetical protein